MCDIQTSRLKHDLPISVNDRVILLFCKGLFSRNFTCAKFCENKTLAKIFEFTVIYIIRYLEGDFQNPEIR